MESSEEEEVNPCAIIPAPELQTECICKVAGQMHCRLHHNDLVPDQAEMDKELYGPDLGGSD